LMILLNLDCSRTTAWSQRKCLPCNRKPAAQHFETGGGVAL
jgi:hypothetical protein